MDQEGITRRERSQSHKARYCRIPLYGVSEIVKLIEAQNRMVVVTGWGREGMAGSYSMSKKFQLCKMNMY